jgi:hypothetical protein
LACSWWLARTHRTTRMPNLSLNRNARLRRLRAIQIAAD